MVIATVFRKDKVLLTTVGSLLSVREELLFYYPDHSLFLENGEEEAFLYPKRQDGELLVAKLDWIATD